ncbi:MAG: Gfo/Idh/MocA family oxidoreductase [Acidimicrobiia bacterium]|nr:Gfo/Idh/MocA family oxidoreductase [Acidimicrobiia bacterium]MDH4308772.1 Gfo/Idh/MocA family oxidoreductase [Acidimicrobiia bacterium]MDH5293123.1 Gfo/Idh/MocA family oxidoreductase [Acidimicrobiia bacterium]
MTEPMRIGIVGAGYWGPNLIRNFVENPNATVVGVADLNVDRLRHIKSLYPQIPNVVSDHTSLLEVGVDGVVVATPPETHAPIAVECLRAGAGVLVEKPFATSSAAAREMIDAAEEADRVLMVGHTFLYNSAVHTLKEMIATEELGDIHYIDAVRVGLGLFHPTHNVVWDLGPHDISILMHLLDEMPYSVSARGVGCLQEGVEDIVYVTLTFPSGIMAHARLSWLDPSKTRRITVVGSRKMTLYDDVEPIEKIRVYDKSVEAIRRTDTFGEFQFAYHYGSIVSPFVRFEEPLKAECGHFVECLATGATPMTDGVNGLRVVEVIEAVQRSLRAGGGPVPVAYGPSGTAVHELGRSAEA